MVLSVARDTESRNKHSKRRLKMGVDTIYAGGMVMMNAAGYLMPAAAESSNGGVIGVATETVANTGSAGDKRCEIEEGDFKFVASSISQGDNLAVMYASDDFTFDETQGSNEPIVGILIEFLTSTSGWVTIGVGVGR